MLMHLRLKPNWFRLRNPILIVLSGLSFAIAVLTAQPTAANIPSNQEIRAVWLTTNDTEVLLDQPKLEAAMTQLAQLNFNTVYPVVWNAGYVMYPSIVAQRAEIQPFVRRGYQGQDMLKDVIEKAHQRGILAIPWFEFGFMAPPMSELTINHPDWFTHKQDGGETSISAAGEVMWMNPFKPEVQRFISDLVMEVVNLYDVDGIQFDDHLSLPTEFGYDTYTSDLYFAETGKRPPADPHNPEWVSWRANKLTAFVTQLQQQIKARKPHLIFSISPNPYDVAYTNFLQDWLTWVRLGIVDELLVQVYRNNLGSFTEQISRESIQEARQYTSVGVGILTGLRNMPVSMDLIQAKVRAARYYGLGVAFFYYESLWEDSPEPPAERVARFQNIFATPAFRAASRI